MKIQKTIVIVRGGGDLATGVIQKLHRSGFKVLVLETEYPTAIRRKVAFSQAIYDGQVYVENDQAVKVKSLAQCDKVWKEGNIPVLIDPKGESIHKVKAEVLVDAIIAKRNLGTKREMAGLVIGLGPGFVAGEDVDIVVETSRGHDLGRLIHHGGALSDTGSPGNIGGMTKKRVIYAPSRGSLQVIHGIGHMVNEGDPIAKIGEEEVLASLDGVVRGMLPDGFEVYQGLKMADIDPRRSEEKNCYTISDKARCLGGSVLEAILTYLR